MSTPKMIFCGKFGVEYSCEESIIINDAMVIDMAHTGEADTSISKFGGRLREMREPRIDRDGNALCQDSRAGYSKCSCTQPR